MASGRWQLVATYLEAHPAEAAALLERLPEVQAAALIEHCPASAAAAVLPRMDPASGAAALSGCDPKRASALLDALDADAAKRLLRRLDAPERERLLAGLPAELGEALRGGLAYPAGSAGGLMDPRALSLPADLAAGEARQRTRRAARFALDLIFVVDREQRLQGALSTRALLLARADAQLAELAERPTASIGAGAGVAAVLAHAAWERQAALPVVDAEGRLLGAIRADSLSAVRVGGAQVAAAGPVAAGLAIGELYWITAARLLGALLGTPGEEQAR